MYKIEKPEHNFWLFIYEVWRVAINSFFRFYNVIGTKAGLGSKLKFTFQLSLNCQIQNQLPIKPYAQIRSSCYVHIIYFDFRV